MDKPLTIHAVNFLRHYLLAVQFFTRLPITGALAQWLGPGATMPQASAAHFPGVGWLVGLAACVAFAVLSLALPVGNFTPLAAAAGCSIVTALLTGGFHERGMASLADGLGGGSDRETALESMKNRAFGAYAAMALVLGLLAKISLLAVLAAQSPVAVLVALFAGHVLSRFWPLLLLRTLPQIGDTAPPNQPLAERIGRTALGIGAAWCVLPLALAVFLQGLAFVGLGLAVSAFALLWMRWRFARRLQGLNGDCLDAAQQVCEIAFYLGCAIALGR